MQPTTLSDYLEDQGYACCICQDTYDTNDRNKKPTLLSCEQHNICIACFEANVNTLKTCPECRAPLTFKGGPILPNTSLVKAMESVAQLWNQMHALKNNAPMPAAVPAMPIERPKPQVPNIFSSLSLCNKFYQFKSSEDEIAAALPSVIQAMGWHDVAKELESEFQKDIQSWFRMVENDDNQSINGVVQLCKVSNHIWEMHWAGVTKDNIELYLDFYKHILFFIKRVDGFSSIDCNWKTASISTNFNYLKEEKWLNAVLGFLNSTKIRYELVYLHPHWGTQAKLKVYPIPPPHHVQWDFDISLNHALIPYKSLNSWMERAVQNILEDFKLKMLFRVLASKGAENILEQELRTEGFCNAFKEHPAQHFVYCIDGKAEGVIRFGIDGMNKSKGKIFVNGSYCLLSPHCLKYADHFIEQFAEWAKANPSYAKGVKATEIEFVNYEKIFPQLRDAIVNYIQSGGQKTNANQ